MRLQNNPGHNPIYNFLISEMKDLRSIPLKLDCKGSKDKKHLPLVFHIHGESNWLMHI